MSVHNYDSYQVGFYRDIDPDDPYFDTWDEALHHVYEMEKDYLTKYPYESDVPLIAVWDGESSELIAVLIEGRIFVGW